MTRIQVSKPFPELPFYTRRYFTCSERTCRQQEGVIEEATFRFDPLCLGLAETSSAWGLHLRKSTTTPQRSPSRLLSMLLGPEHRSSHDLVISPLQCRAPGAGSTTRALCMCAPSAASAPPSTTRWWRRWTAQRTSARLLAVTARHLQDEVF